MKRLLLLAGLSAMVGLAAPANAAPAGIDGQFLATLSGAGLSHRANDEATVSAGHAVCQLMDAGLSPMDTVVAVQTTNPGFTIHTAAQFAAISTAHYCPQYM
ncbi:hypothetical protein ABW16_18920 [Mycolicibacter heraklionensis]|uniref:DUF732 domain-containing protein n=1 Tax=Mycolicibacter heraklionensis TaxID=512402 RepID=A0A9X7WGL1_9MYCO|nr:DUF732 domain-containing protein [Mycolicibacter heraklionensis]KLO26587.1 hypothetical protein ABW16_18920 [Mycolicibacter heraklionensis]QZA07004.1 DUF732 domain-containing protein [Mycolicibacter heraklionensis]